MAKSTTKTTTKPVSGAGADRKARAAVLAIADFIASLPPQPSGAEAKRKAALEAAGACGWKG